MQQRARYGARYTIDVGPYKSTHRFCEDATDLFAGCKKRTLNERINGWLAKMASVEVHSLFHTCALGEEIGSTATQTQEAVE